MSTTLQSNGTHGATQHLDEAKKAYMLPHNKAEIDRMKNQHEWIKASFGGLIKVPIDLERSNLRILDSATADGTWLCDVSTLVPPSAKLIGFDIAPELFAPPSVLPPNVHLHIADLSQPLPESWLSSFDLVNQRFVFPGFPDPTINSFLSNLLSCVKPGGWVQLLEPAADINISAPEATSFAVLHKLAKICMATPSSSNIILNVLKQKGFVNIGIETKDLVIGGQENKEVGLRGKKSMRAAVVNMAPMVGPVPLGIPESEWDLEKLLQNFDADLERHRCAVRHVVIWAQRPE